MKFKKAFTFAELLLCIAIIGVISSYAVYTVTRYDKGIRYIYSNVYHNLDRALFNAVNFTDLANPFDSAITPQEGARRLCEMLIYYINTSTANCTADNLASTDGVNFGGVKFQSLNGFNFYISKRLPNSPASGEHTFFLVYADINGEKMPNSMNYVAPSAENRYKTTDPDTFAFAALDIGRVCPLGIPEIEPRYMQARIAYVSTNAEGDGEEEVTTKYTVVSRPYYQAKAEAWGYHVAGNPAFDNNPIDEEPTSYNGYVKSKLGNTAIYSFLNGASTLKVPANIHLLSGTFSSGEYGCVERSPEECWVIVDRYLY